MFAIVAIEIDSPASTTLRQLIAQGSQRNSGFDSPDLRCVIDFGGRLSARGPAEILFRKIDFQVERLAGRSPLELGIAFRHAGIRSDERFDNIIIPQTEPLPRLDRCKDVQLREGTFVTDVKVLV